MKKQKFYRFTALSLGSAAAVIAPLATVVACGDSGKKTGGSTADTGISLIDASTKVDKSGILAPADTTAYSATSLRDEAKKIGHTSAWIKGPTYHAVSSFVSFADQLAEAYGYSTTKDSNGLTQLEKDNKDQSVILLGDKDHQAVYDAQATKTPSLTFLNSLKSDKPLTESQKSDLALVFGDNENADKYTLSSLNVTSDIADVSANSAPIKVKVGSSDETVTLWHYSVIQTNTPGRVELSLYSTDKKIQRKIIIDNATPVYPIVSDEVLRDDFAPYVKSMILKFIEIYQGDGMASSASMFIAPEILNKIKFLIDVNTVNNNGQKTLKIDDAKFFDALKTLNNSSTDWLALKAFYKGFDSSLTTVDMTPYNGNKYYGIEATATGVKDLTGIIQLKDWAHYNSFGALKPEGTEIRTIKEFDQLIRDVHPGDNKFYPSMDVNELAAANKVVMTDAFKAFIAKYSGDPYTLIKNKAIINATNNKIAEYHDNIIGLDSTNTDVQKWVADSIAIYNDSLTVTDVTVSNKQVSDIKAIEAKISAVWDDKSKARDQIKNKVKTEWTALKLTGNGATSALKTDDVISINELEAILASGNSLPTFPANNPANNDEYVFNFAEQPDQKAFKTPAEKDAKVFKVVSHVGDVLKLEVKIFADTARGYRFANSFLGWSSPTGIEAIQFEISNIKN